MTSKVLTLTIGIFLILASICSEQAVACGCPGGCPPCSVCVDNTCVWICGSGGSCCDVDISLCYSGL